MEMSSEEKETGDDEAVVMAGGSCEEDIEINSDNIEKSVTSEQCQEHATAEVLSVGAGMEEGEDGAQTPAEASEQATATSSGEGGAVSNSEEDDRVLIIVSQSETEHSESTPEEMGASPERERGSEQQGEGYGKQPSSAAEDDLLNVLSQSADEMDDSTSEEMDASTSEEMDASASEEIDAYLMACEPVLSFVTRDELLQHVGALPRLPVVRLTSQSALDGHYIGGKVIAYTMESPSQGSTVSVLVKDSSSPLHVTVLIRGELAHMTPSLITRPELFVYNASVEQRDDDEFSQDFDKILVMDAEARGCVWVLQGPEKAPPAPGKKWWKKHKKRVIALKQKAASSRAGEGGAGSGQPAAATEEEEPMTSHSYKLRVRKQPHGSMTSDNVGAPESTDGTYNPPQDGSPSSSDSEVPDRPRRAGNTGRSYEYKSLLELHPGDKKVNVFGVVQEFSPAVPTRSADYSSSVVLVDESCPQEGVKAVFFNRHSRKLPQVQRVGDIVCLHRVNVELHMDTIRIDGSPYSSSLCFNGSRSGSLKPRTGAHSYTLTSGDKQRIVQLREWASRQQPPPPQSAANLTKLQHVSPDAHFNLLCQVVSTARYFMPQCVVLEVWDGTHLPLKQRTHDAYNQYRLPLALPIMPQSYTSPGLTVRVVVYDSECQTAACNLQSGDFILLHNVHTDMTDTVNKYRERIPVVELCLRAECQSSPNNLIMRLNDGSPLVDNLSNTLYCFTEPVSLITTTELPPVTAAVTLATLSQNAPDVKYLCRARLVCVCTPMEELVVVSCPCCLTVFPMPPLEGVAAVSLHPCSQHAVAEEEATAADSPACYYSFELAIEDGTGSLNIYCRGSHALKLLNGLPPSSLHSNAQARQTLLRKLSLLTGGHDPFTTNETAGEPRPSLDLCISRPNPASPFHLVNTVITPQHS